MQNLAIFKYNKILTLTLTLILSSSRILNIRRETWEGLDMFKIGA